ncbi:MAG: LamG domain-containing protein [Bacteroidales bacterium]|nr:LamG domain-containing protein [Bacteroidales bacterium]
MKKVLMLVAAGLMMAACSLEDLQNLANDVTDKLTEVQTAKDNLVVYLPLESETNAVKVGEGITFDSKVGAAGFAKGEVGQGYTNTSAKNDEAYLKFKLAKDNALTKLEDVTVTMWLKNVEEFQKGGILSVNGKLFEGQDWPSLVLLFDNKGVEKDEEGNETGVKTQQVNGRIMFKKDDGSETNLWLATWDKAFAVYDKWFQFGFTYVANTGAWSLYVDGVKINDAEYGDKMPFGKCIPADANTLYLGAWASFIEKFSSAEWQCSFAGSIDEVRFYNKALSETEMAELYKEEVKNSLLK